MIVTAVALASNRRTATAYPIEPGLVAPVTKHFLPSKDVMMAGVGGGVGGGGGGRGGGGRKSSCYGDLSKHRVMSSSSSSSMR